MAGGAGDFGGGAGNGGVNPNGHYDGGGSGDTGGTDPVPYPDIGGDGDDYGSGADIKDVRLDADSVDTSAGGDEPGVGGGVTTAPGTDPSARFVTSSEDVKYEGKNVVRHMDSTTNSTEPKDGEEEPGTSSSGGEPESGVMMDPYEGPGTDPWGPGSDAPVLHFGDDMAHELDVQFVHSAMDDDAGKDVDADVQIWD